MGYCYDKAIKIKNIKAKLTSKNIVSCSFGKDSTAMCDKMLKLNKEAREQGLDEPYPIDEIVFADAVWEFDIMYEYIEKISTMWFKKYGVKTTILTPDKGLWDKWFYGVWGKTKKPKKSNYQEIKDYIKYKLDMVKYDKAKLKEGTPRGQPKVITPCWWSRESKVYALERYFAKCSKILYVGIAYDEQKRIKKDPLVRYPLNEWGWTELDCASYLKKHDMWCNLYDYFDRTGCFMCHKQSPWSWYMLWKQFPKHWKQSKELDKESRKITFDSHGLNIELTLEQMEKKFKSGFIPERKKNFVGRIRNLDESESCDAVASSFNIRQKKLDEYFKQTNNL